ncbi:MAG: hypothetical protein HQK96_12920 [Nitrospirae bacterium]|nr:hypothetical protein [Nitrospirota bacterium]
MTKDAKVLIGYAIACVILLIIAFCGNRVKAATFALGSATTTGAISPVIVVPGGDSQIPAYTAWWCDVEPNANTTAAVVRIEGSAHSAVFDPAGMFTITCTNTQLTVGKCSGGGTGLPVSLMRANITTLTDNGSPGSISVSCSGGY